MSKFVKYFITGGISAIVDFAIFATLVTFTGCPWYVAATISFVVSTLMNYFISVRHVFTSGARFGRKQEIALTFLVSVIGLALNQAILYLLIHRGIPVLLAKIGATGVVFFWNYTARHYFVFKEIAMPRNVDP